MTTATDRLVIFLITIGVLAGGILGYTVFGLTAIIVTGAISVGILVTAQLWTHRTVKRRLDRLERSYYQTQALFSLHSTLTLHQPLPNLDPWSAAPDFLVLLIQLIREAKPRLIVELGSGASTLVSALVLKEIGQGKIVSLDHEKAYAQRTEALLNRHDVDTIAHVKHAPLQEISLDSRTYNWYDPTALEDLGSKVDMLIIDGPPSVDDDMARYPALPMLHSQLSRQAIIVLDDADRTAEKNITDRWETLFPDCSSERFPTQRGAQIFRRDKVEG